MTNGDTWPLCTDNSGFAASSFLSVAFGLNLVLAKWEPFKKSLTDVEAQFKTAFDSEVKRRKISAEIVDDANDEEGLIEDLCKEPLEEIRYNNSLTWNSSRRWAIAFSCTAVVLLYFHISGGFWAAFFVLPTVIATLSAIRSKYKISGIVRDKIQSLHDVRKVQKKIQDRKAQIEDALS